MAEPTKPVSKSPTSPLKSTSTTAPEPKKETKPEPTTATLVSTSSASSSSAATKPTSPPPASVPDLKKESAKPDDEPPTAAESDKTLINMDIFQQILDLDDDDPDHDFSKQMVEEYFSQATTTFEDMDKALSEKKLQKLSELGHFLKGSSAALGIEKVQDLCADIQYYGELRDETNKRNLDQSEALSLITTRIVEVKREYKRAQLWLVAWYKKEYSLTLQEA